MTEDERAARIHHHEMETLEGIHEHAERIACLEELVLDLWPRAEFTMTQANRASYLERMRDLEIEVEE